MQDEQEFDRQAEAMLYLLREIAQRRKISHQAIADRIGWKQTNVSRLFTAKYSPTLPNFLRLADALGIRVILESDDGSLEAEMQRILEAKKFQ